MSDWAETKAREWLRTSGLLYSQDSPRWEPSLAALLREVDKQGAVNATPLDGWIPLAEVRRVVEGTKGAQIFCDCVSCSSWDGACDEILSRLEKL